MIYDIYSLSVIKENYTGILNPNNPDTDRDLKTFRIIDDHASAVNKTNELMQVPIMMGYNHIPCYGWVRIVKTFMIPMDLHEMPIKLPLQTAWLLTDEIIEFPPVNNDYVIMKLRLNNTVHTTVFDTLDEIEYMIIRNSRVLSIDNGNGLSYSKMHPITRRIVFGKTIQLLVRKTVAMELCGRNTVDSSLKKQTGIIKKIIKLFAH